MLVPIPASCQVDTTIQNLGDERKDQVILWKQNSSWNEEDPQYNGPFLFSLRTNI